jgi:hypothetical protein
MGQIPVFMKERLQALCQKSYKSDMDKMIYIVESDAMARRALEKMFLNEGLSGFCHIVAPGHAGSGSGDLHFHFGEQESKNGSSNHHYFTKPVRIGNVLSRIQAIIFSDDVQDTIAFGQYILNNFSHELMCDGKTTRLTEKESRILKMLAEAEGATVSRKNLLDQVWQYADGIETHTLETHIYRLRQKIEADPAKPQLLLTEEAGYRLVV